MMETMDSLQTWKAFQGKLRNSGANSVYSAREMLVQEYVNQQRMKQPDVPGGVHELSPRHAPIDSPSDNISSYCLSHSPPSDQLPLQQGRRPISSSRPGLIQRANEPSEETRCCTKGGFETFVNGVVGRAQYESDGPDQGLPHHSDSSSPFVGLFFARPNMTRRRSSMGSEPFVVPSSTGRIPSDRPDPFYGYHHNQRYNSVDSLCVSATHTTSEQSSQISILSDEWTQRNHETNDADEKADAENSFIMLPRPTRRLSEPFSLHSRFNDAPAHAQTNNTPFGCSQRALPKSVGNLLVEFPSTKESRAGPRISPSKLLVDFPTTKQKQTRSQERKAAIKAAKQTGPNFNQ